MTKKYRVRVPAAQIDIAEDWCVKNFEPDVWESSPPVFAFEDEINASAFKLRFDEPKMVIMVDPPEGWKYGFPKPCKIEKDQDFDKWLIENGYPKELVDQGLSKYCRYWEKEVL